MWTKRNSRGAPSTIVTTMAMASITAMLYVLDLFSKKHDATTQRIYAGKASNVWRAVSSHWKDTVSKERKFIVHCTHLRKRDAKMRNERRAQKQKPDLHRAPTRLK
jgi:hypothetical protein